MIELQSIIGNHRGSIFFNEERVRKVLLSWRRFSILLLASLNDSAQSMSRYSLLMPLLNNLMHGYLLV